MTTPDFFLFVLICLATARLTRLITTDQILSPLRDRVWKKWPPESSKIGYVLTCDWCTSMWASSALVLMSIISTTLVVVVASVLAASLVAGAITARL